MRVLIIDPNGYCLDWSLRAKACGHDVKHFIKDKPDTNNIGEGLVDITRDFTPWLIWADLIFCSDNVLYVQQLGAFKAKYPNACVIGGNAEAAELELDRIEGMRCLEDYGVMTPAYEEFTDYDKAIEYVKREDRRFVSKPNGDADKALSYVSKTPADLVYMLERWKKASKLKDSFILQEFIEGTEMAVGGWYGPGGWNEGWCENFEFKKFMNDDLGVATGEQGTVIQIVRKSKLARQVLEPITPYLDKIGYVGYVDVNCIIDEDGIPWPLEFTTRPGWPTFNIQQELSDGDCAEWLRDLAQGRDGANWRIGPVGLGVVLSIPDYPYSHVTKKEVTGIPIYGLKPTVMDNIHLCEIMLGEAPVSIRGSIVQMPHLVTAGDYLLVAAASASTIQQAKKLAYKTLKKLVVPNSPMYRTDIGDRLKKQLPIIQAMGYATNLQY